MHLLFLSDAYNTVKCDFAHSATTDVTNQFEIVDNEIKVRAGATLDRESQDKYVFELSCNDDPDQQGTINQDAFVCYIILIQGTFGILSILLP